MNINHRAVYNRTCVLRLNAASLACDALQCRMTHFASARQSRSRHDRLDKRVLSENILEPFFFLSPPLNPRNYHAETAFCRNYTSDIVFKSPIVIQGNHKKEKVAVSDVARSIDKNVKKFVDFKVRPMPIFDFID